MDFIEDFRRLRALKKKGLAERVSDPFVGQLFKKVGVFFPSLERGELPAPTLETSQIPAPSRPPQTPKARVTNGELPGLVLKRDLVEGVGVLVAFVAEIPRDFCESEEGGLLSKMIKALPFEKGETVRILFDRRLGREEIGRTIIRDLCKLRPRAVVTLGALATNLSLGRKERLSLVHGKELELSVPGENGQASFPCFPVFHPDFLHINPSMKRTAWHDLQKVAGFLGKKISD